MVWNTNTTPITVRRLAPVSGYPDSWANDINESGVIVGGAAVDAGAPVAIPVRWNTDGSVTKLKSDSYGTATSISDDRRPEPAGRRRDRPPALRLAPG